MDLLPWPKKSWDSHTCQTTGACMLKRPCTTRLHSSARAVVSIVLPWYTISSVYIDQCWLRYTWRQLRCMCIAHLVNVDEWAPSPIQIETQGVRRVSPPLAWKLCVDGDAIQTDERMISCQLSQEKWCKLWARSSAQDTVYWKWHTVAKILMGHLVQWSECCIFEVRGYGLTPWQ